MKKQLVYFLVILLSLAALMIGSYLMGCGSSGGGGGETTTTTTLASGLSITAISPTALTTVETTFPTIEVTFNQDMATPELGWFLIDDISFEATSLSASGKKITISSLSSSIKSPDGLHTFEAAANVTATSGNQLGAKQLHQFYTKTAYLKNYFHTPSTADFYFNPPIMDGSGNIYLGTSNYVNGDPSENNYFYKLNSSLNEVWSYSLGNNEVRGAAVMDSGGSLYFIVEKGRLAQNYTGAANYLYKLNSSGSKQWEVEIPSFISGWGFYCPAVSSNDIIYIGGQGLYAFNTDGQQQWLYNNQLDIRNAPAIDSAGKIYFVALDTSGSTPQPIEVYCLNSSGTLEWKSSTGQTYGDATISSYFSSPAINADGNIVAAINQKVYCLSKNDGSTIWSTSTSVSGKFMASPVIDATGNVYIGTKADTNSAFYAFSGSDGSLLWTNSLGADIYCTAALGNDGTIYIGNETNTNVNTTFTVLNRSTGSLVWQVQLPFGTNIMLTSPLIASDGTVYVANMRYTTTTSPIKGGAVYAFEISAGGLLTNAAWPRFRGSNAGSGRK